MARNMQNTVTERREKSTLSPNMLIISHFTPPRLFCHCGCAASIAKSIDPQSHKTLFRVTHPSPKEILFSQNQHNNNS